VRRVCATMKAMKSRLEDILARVHKGILSPREALRLLKDYPYQDLAFAKIDHHRELRRGFPEVIFGQGKTPAQIIGIAREIIKKGNNLLVTKVEPAVYRKVRQKLPEVHYHAAAKTAYCRQKEMPQGKGTVAVITAGTSDIPVAEEAAITCEVFGNRVERIYDVGVAGLHRLFGEYEKIAAARVLIVAAGMEGALPSVVAGITDKPIVAVPTSVGYGASLQGAAALLTMLNSCPGGLAVVNIDNGFGAGYYASLINHI